MPEGSINDHLRAGRPFSHYECEQIFAQSSDALAYLHTLDPQIVHRDVKPDNLMILHRRPRDLFIKFADFGMSREGDTLKSICGTFVYLAPEVYEGNSIPRKQRALIRPLLISGRWASFSPSYCVDFPNAKRTRAWEWNGAGVSARKWK